MKCCQTCPFIPSNANKPTPEDWLKNNPEGRDWFTDNHLRELWDGIREGEFLACHSTLEGFAEHVGKGVSEKTKPRMCIGAMIAAYAHFKLFEKQISLHHEDDPDETYKHYLKEAGEAPMTLNAIINFVEVLQLGRTSLFGGLSVPTSFSPPDELRSSWVDPVLADFKSLIQ